MRRLLIILLIALTTSLAGSAMARAWEEVNRFPVNQTEQTIDTDDVSVAVHDGYVYVSVRQTSGVKLFTILGQLIVQQNLRPGIYRYRLSSRGIYLLKAGATTRRITI